MTEVALNADVLPLPEVCGAYLTQYTKRFDYSDLRRFAHTTIPLASRSIYPDTADEDQKTIAPRMARALKKFNPDLDYLVLVGDPLLQAIAMFTLGCVVGGRSVMVLRHDSQQKAYWPFRIGFDPVL